MAMSLDVSPLFEPIGVKGHAFRNRIVMPPMATNRGIVSPAGLEWYGEHAAAGVGLVIVEATAVGRFGGDLNLENLGRLVEAIHDGGAMAAIQLFPVAFGRAVAPAEFGADEIKEIIRRFETAARMCAEAGFDGVEPHGAHGFVLNQFFSPPDNTRTDAFGGALENRMRMGIEVVRACRRGIGDDRLLLYRHTPVKEASYTLDESVVFAGKLAQEGVDILDISPASSEAPADLAKPFRGLCAAVIGVGLMDEVERALEALVQGRADLIAVGRGLIADPLWPTKVREGRFDDIVSCTRCNEKCHGNLSAGLPVECTQW